MSAPRTLRVRNARQHNLRGVDLELPRDRLVVITGPSGSGKSSLAFDTIYAEGRRRYVESLSVHARQLLGQLRKPEVDSIEGLSPALSVQQHAVNRNPRSTVGTATEIYDYLRLLYARVGVPHSPATGAPMVALTPQQIVDRVLALPEQTRVQVLAPVEVADRAALRETVEKLRADGFVRALLDGAPYDLAEPLPTCAAAPRLEVVVDRVKVRPGVRARLAEAVELALSRAGGVVRLLGDDLDWTLSSVLMCPATRTRYAPLTPRSFSFNTPEGACPECVGLGVVERFDPALVVPEWALSIEDGAIRPWGHPEGAYYAERLAALRKALRVDTTKPWRKLSDAQRARVLQGSAKWPGVIPALERQRAEYAERRRRGQPGAAPLDDTLGQLEAELAAFARAAPCPACEGTRLAPLPRGVTVEGVPITALGCMDLAQLAAFVEGLPVTALTERLLSDVGARLRFLLDMGLDYLTLERSMMSLSGGEAERIRLAAQLGAGLVGVLYVLDEPSAGLHARDNHKLIRSLQRLRDAGNSVLVVEHDLDMVRAADHVVDLGPGAGERGGTVVAQGSVEEVAARADSPTGRFLAGLDAVPVPSRRRRATASLVLHDARTHNLQGVRAAFPIGALTCVTGVSGSGKSSLVMDTLLPAVRAALAGQPGDGGARLEGVGAIERVLEVDQAPIGRSARANPASYVGALAEIRAIFAGLPEARARGYGNARFSFNVRGGRCEACQGEGLMRVSMHFLPDVLVPCERCGGARYNRETLDVRYRGYSIADVLDLTVDEAAALFAAHPKLAFKLERLREVGLGYLRLGQPGPSLSGGEAQRVKLARELARRASSAALIVLDEPTAGLHSADVALLVELLQRTVDAGNTLVVVEHHMDVIKSADHVIDLGPEGGPGGGRVVAAGTPEEVARQEGSLTAPYLAAALAARGAGR